MATGCTSRRPLGKAIARLPTRRPILLDTFAVTLTLGLLCLLPLAYAAFRAGRDGGVTTKVVAAAGLVGLGSVIVLGLVAPLMMVGAFALIGSGSAAPSQRIGRLVGGAAILAAPLFLMGVFYMASQNT